MALLVLRVLAPLLIVPCSFGVRDDMEVRLLGKEDSTRASRAHAASNGTVSQHAALAEVSSHRPRKRQEMNEYEIYSDSLAEVRDKGADVASADEAQAEEDVSAKESAGGDAAEASASDAGGDAAQAGASGAVADAAEAGASDAGADAAEAGASDVPHWMAVRKATLKGFVVAYAADHAGRCPPAGDVHALDLPGWDVEFQNGAGCAMEDLCGCAWSPFYSCATSNRFGTGKATPGMNGAMVAAFGYCRVSMWVYLTAIFLMISVIVLAYFFHRNWKNWQAETQSDDAEKKTDETPK